MYFISPLLFNCSQTTAIKRILACYDKVTLLSSVLSNVMNEENEWDHKISAEVKEGPADCIRMDEVRAALKKMKKHKAPGLSGLVAEMIQATGDTGTQWILDLCNGIVNNDNNNDRLTAFDPGQPG